MKYRIKKRVNALGAEEFKPQFKPSWFPFWLDLFDYWSIYSEQDAEWHIRQDIENRKKYKIVKREIINYE